jgi:hypothetical protein
VRSTIGAGGEGDIMQTALTIGIPTIVILMGILLNRQDYARLDAKIDALRLDLSGQINELRSDIKEFYRTLGQHDARLDALERTRKS